MKIYKNKKISPKVDGLFLLIRLSTLEISYQLKEF